MKMEQEAELRDYIHTLGGSWPFELGENEKRMQTEVYDSIEKNDGSHFNYSRGAGSGLRVPKHTNLAGDPLQNPMSPQSLSPSMGSGGSATNSNTGQMWMNQGNGNSDAPGDFNFKEEDEYNMEM